MLCRPKKFHIHADGCNFSSAWRCSVCYYWCREAISTTGSALAKSSLNWCYFSSVARQSDDSNLLWNCDEAELLQPRHGYVQALSDDTELKRFLSVCCNYKDSFWELQIIFHKAQLTCSADEEKTSKFLSFVCCTCFPLQQPIMKLSEF